MVRWFVFYILNSPHLILAKISYYHNNYKFFNYPLYFYLRINMPPYKYHYTYDWSQNSCESLDISMWNELQMIKNVKIHDIKINYFLEILRKF